MVNKCDYPRITGLILVSKYMVKKYGAAEAISRIIKYKYKYSGGIMKSKKK